MTITYSLGIQPKWYLVDNSGKPTAGFMFSYSSLNLTQYKPVYQDASNNFPYPQPVPFAANGTSGPLYFSFDDTNPDDLYYLAFFDSDMNPLYTINNYNPANGGSGGGSITTAVNLKSYTGNNVFLYNVGSTPSPVANGVVLAPSNHSSFIDPDIRFFNNNVGGTDVINFIEFITGSNPLTGDVTPQYYLEYNCSVAGGETKKYIQFPIQPKVSTLDAQTITITFWARSIGGLGNIISMQIRQFFGTPTPLVTPTADVFTIIGAPISLTSSWTRYSISGVIPGVAGSTLGITGDDAIYLILELPTAITSIIDITKPSLYIGNIAPQSDFNSTDQIESLIQSPRTGDTKFGMQYANYVPLGWIAYGNVTIGNSLSNSTYSNINTWFLFTIVWNVTNNSNCPVYNSDGTLSTRGVSAQADWEANKRLLLPLNNGAVISNTGNGHIIGDSGGADVVSLSSDQNGPHTHTNSVGTSTSVAAGAFLARSNLASASNSITINTSGLGTPHENRQPTTYIPCIMKL